MLFYIFKSTAGFVGNDYVIDRLKKGHDKSFNSGGPGVYSLLWNAALAGRARRVLDKVGDDNVFPDEDDEGLTGWATSNIIE